MAKSLSYYKGLSEQLQREIEIYEGSYQGFEKAINLDVEPISSWSEEQRSIATEFVTFYQNEGIYSKGINRARYPKIKEAIIERVKFLKEQKALVDQMVSLHSDLDKMKNKGEIDSAMLESLKSRAQERYDEGTAQYNDYLEKLKKQCLANRIEKTNEALKEATVKIRKSKQDNGFGKVVSSVFGPVGNRLYNAIAWVHNKNVDLRKRRISNLLVKLAMVFGYTALVASMSLGGLPLVIAAGVSVASLINTFRHTFQPVPEKMKLKDKVGSLRDNWFRFRKSRGKDTLVTEQVLYQGVDFSKYEKADKDKKAGDFEEEKADEDKKDSDFEEEKADEDKKDSDFEEEKADEDKKDSDFEEEKADEDKKAKEKAGKKDNLPESNSGIEINSMADVIQVCDKFRQQNGIVTTDDYLTLRNVRLYLGNLISKTGDKKYIELRDMFDEMAKNITPELKARIDALRVFEGIDVSNKRKKMATNVRKATDQYHKQEFSRIVDLIETAPATENVLIAVNYFLNHYEVSKEERDHIMKLLQEREEEAIDNMQRGK